MPRVDITCEHSYDADPEDGPFRITEISAMVRFNLSDILIEFMRNRYIDSDEMILTPARELIPKNSEEQSISWFYYFINVLDNSTVQVSFAVEISYMQRKSDRLLDQD